MNGRITRLIDDQQFGTIAAEDGNDYVFHGRALVDVRFGALHVGATVTFAPIASAGSRRAEAVRASAPKKTTGPDVERLR
jgi:cold shock CspA family protein